MKTVDYKLALESLSRCVEELAPTRAVRDKLVFRIRELQAAGVEPKLIIQQVMSAALDDLHSDWGKAEDV